MNKATRIGIAALMLSVGASVWAGTPAVNARQDRQEHRIAQGVASGQLTLRESSRLLARQQHIANVEYRAKADGVVTRSERVRLHLKQDRASAAIARQKHDGQRRR